MILVVQAVVADFTPLYVLRNMAASKDQHCPCVFKAKPASKTVRVRTRNEEVEGGFTKRRLIIVTRQKDDNNTKDKRLKDCEKYLLKLKRRLTIKGAFV